MESIPTRDNPSVSFFVPILRRRIKNVRQEWKKCSKKLSEPSVHDVRVALRRLLFSLQLLQNAYPDLFPHNLVNPIKKTFKKFSTLRDLQVMQKRFYENLEHYRSLIEVAQDLEKTIQKQQSKLKKFFRQTSIRQLLKPVQSTLKHLSKMTTTKIEFTILDQGIQTTFDELRKRARKMRVQDVDSIHQLRIALKKYRYQMEAYCDLLNLPRTPSFEELHRQQTLLGDIHDYDVLLNFLLDWRIKHYGKGSRHLQRPLQRFRKEQALLLSQLTQAKKTLLQLTPQKIIQSEVS